MGDFTTALCCSPLQLWDSQGVQPLGRFRALCPQQGALLNVGIFSWGTQRVTRTQPAPSSTSRKQEKAAFESQSCLFPSPKGSNPLLGSEEWLVQPPAMTGSRNCLLSTDLTFLHHRLQVMDHFVFLLVSFTRAKRKPRNCRKYSFIPHNHRIREWDEEQQMQPCQVAGSAVSSPDPDFQHQGNH